MTSTVILLVSWCFEPSQPQRVTPGLTPTTTIYRNIENYNNSCAADRKILFYLSSLSPLFLCLIKKKKKVFVIVYVLMTTVICFYFEISPPLLKTFCKIHYFFAIIVI